MSTNREKFLNKIKNSLPHSLLPEATPEPPASFQSYSFEANTSVEALVNNFKQELEALSGHVHVLENNEQIVGKILEILEKHQAKRIITWSDESLGLRGFREALTQAGITIVADKLPQTDRKPQLAEMDDVLVGLTGAHGGLADTGAIALISGPSRGRLTSLMPPVHIALLPKSCLYPSLPSFLAANPNATNEGSNLVFIAGPSRTGDIEMTLSMGVHGPGEVHVIITP